MPLAAGGSLAQPGGLAGARVRSSGMSTPLLALAGPALASLLLACQQGASPDAAAPPAQEAAPAPAPSPVPSTFVGAPRPDRAAARHILITYSGSVAAGPEIQRTEHEARVLAEQLRQRVVAGEDFASLARVYSDDTTKARGGDLGAFGKGAMVEAFEAAAFALDDNLGLSEVVQTPFGFHVIQRYPLEEIRVAQVLVQHAGVQRTASQRPADEARARAEQARARLVAGEPFDVVAKELSDGPSASRGGDLGWFQRGQMMPQFDQAAFALAPGQVSELVESPLGFHVIVRLE